MPQHDHLRVVDLGSTNGTFLNARRIVGEALARPEDLIQFADVPFRVLRQISAAQTSTISHDVVDQALALVQFESLMSQEAAVPYYQAIVELDSGACLGYEVLGRSRMPGLETPVAMFSVAAQLGLEFQLSRMLRVKGVEESRALPTRPHLFLNTHPAELREPALIESLKALRTLAGSQRLTLEIHEAAVAELEMLRHLQSALAELQFDLAFDDFGAGQARLLELLELHPSYVKFDMSLVRGIDQAPREHRQMLTALVKMVSDIGARPLAEGIETAAELGACREMGFVLGQGFFFGRPAPLC